MKLFFYLLIYSTTILAQKPDRAYYRVGAENNPETLRCRGEVNREIACRMAEVNSFGENEILVSHSVRMQGQNCNGFDSTMSVIPSGMKLVSQTFYNLKKCLKVRECYDQCLSSEFDYLEMNGPSCNQIFKTIDQIFYKELGFEQKLYIIEERISNIEKIFFDYDGYLSKHSEIQGEIEGNKLTFYFHWSKKQSKYFQQSDKELIEQFFKVVLFRND